MKLGTILCYIVIATVLFLLLGFISLVFSLFLALRDNEDLSHSSFAL